MAQYSDINHYWYIERIGHGDTRAEAKVAIYSTNKGKSFHNIGSYGQVDLIKNLNVHL